MDFITGYYTFYRFKQILLILNLNKYSVNRDTKKKLIIRLQL
jgi:hypothetical protein